jgi:predicted ArsR family transcriptional regulator
MGIRTILDELPATRGAILKLMKAEGFISIPRAAEALRVSHEAARKQIGEMLRNGWISSECEPPEPGRQSPAGRPSVRYCLTPEGDHFFVKQYPEMTVHLLDAIVAAGGDAALTATLAVITDERVNRLEAKTGDLPLKRRMNALRGIYRDGDPHTEVQKRGDDYVLIERNCPYLDVALERPDICSTTVSALRRLTGCEVVRERRFQDGDRRCEFHVRTAEASAERSEVRFEKEPSRTLSPGS